MKRTFERIAFMLAGAAIFVGGVLNAGTVTRPNSYTAGTTITASELNADLDTLYTLVNGNIDDDNVDSLSASEISGTAATLTGAGEQTISRNTQFTGSTTLNGTFICDEDVTFSDGDTTPDVSGGATCFKTANTGATEICQFDGGVAGQVIIVKIGDSNTNIDGDQTCNTNTGTIRTKDEDGANGADDIVNGKAGTDTRTSRYTAFIYDDDLDCNSEGHCWVELFYGGTT